MRKHYRANKIIPTEDVKQKQKDVETRPTSKTGDSKVTAEVSLDEKQQQENKDLINNEASGPILVFVTSKVDTTAAVVDGPKREISE